MFQYDYSHSMMSLWLSRCVIHVGEEFGVSDDFGGAFLLYFFVSRIRLTLEYLSKDLSPTVLQMKRKMKIREALD